MELNYEKDICIDEKALDIEWLEQAELMRRYASHLAKTGKGMDLAKEKLEIGRANIELSIRKEPERYGISKITESAVQSTILLQEEYQKLSQEYIEAKYENNIALAAVRALDQKKMALENLVKLLQASYFAAPKTIRDLTQERVEKEEARRKNAKIKIRQRTRRGE